MQKKLILILFIIYFFILMVSNDRNLLGKSALRQANDTIPISEIRKNNSNGEPLLKGQIVTISGEVTVSNQFYLPAFIQDKTAGVAVYDSRFATTVNIGDSVTISGMVDQYQGLTELKDVQIVERISQTPSIKPLIVTCQQIASDGAGGVENYEGKMVQVNNVTVNTTRWTVSGAGANFKLTDATGVCEIRIDNDTDIANTLAPNGHFDIIGVVSQYDYSSPYKSGYQLMPRFREDIILYSGPLILSGPEEKNMTSTSMSIIWETSTPANSIIMYGKTSNYEIDTLQIEESVSRHERLLTNLLPATVYHVKVGSGDNSGINYSSDHIVITVSDPSSTGEMNIYFNRSVDHSLAFPGNEANGRENLIKKFTDRIHAANYSIDFCIFSWNLKVITDSLISAYKRGVQIRVIYENDAFYFSEVNRLKQEGIIVIDDAYSYNSGEDLQHNKFAIFDARDSTFASDDWIWTGSLNFTDSDEGGFYAIQNVIEIQDQSLAKAYTLEFNEMWGSANSSPDANHSRFGSNKTDNIPHKFIVHGVPIELYMSPSDGTLSKIINVVNTADHEIFFSILSFTRYDLMKAMQARFLSPAKIRISGVFDSGLDQYSQYYAMNGEGQDAWNPRADVFIENEPGVLHHKYMIIDGEHPASDPIVITGSQNWSTSGETKNDENTLIIHSAEIANQYLQEFAHRYVAAGGKGEFISDIAQPGLSSLPNSLILHQNYPNPFNSETIIQFSIDKPAQVSLGLFDINGKLIETLTNRFLQPQEYKLKFSARNLPSGVYIYRLTSHGERIVRKLVVLR